MGRRWTIVLALAFIVLFGALTTFVIVTSGLDLLTGVSLVLLVALGSGVVGALRHPPDE